MNITDKVPDHIRNLIPYNPGKPIEEVEREFGIEGCVKLASNENPLGPSPKALRVLQERIKEIHLYPDGDCYNLKRGVAAKLKVPPDRLIFGNGSNEIIELAVRTFMGPGDEAVMDHLAFSIFRLVVQSAGGKCKIVPSDNFTVDLDAIGRAVTPRTRILFLANPNNPTGTIFRRSDWEAFLSRVGPDILVVMDEAYFEYVQERDYPNSLDYAGENWSILTLRTFSKIYGLAGLRIGYGVGSEDLIGLMHRVRQPFNVNAAAQWAALAALEDDDFLARTREVNQQGMAYLKTELTKLGLEQVPSYANFILVRVGEGQDCFQRLLRRGVIVRPMEGYDLPEYVRVTVGTMKENQKFIDELRAVVGGKESA
ncbi:MAG: histidinol-phosphate transaminase [Deltaproteobacteria bacterium]|nr:histidinol-phosphate transaminase [Deltaproteobacteria bacterium]